MLMVLSPQITHCSTTHGPITHRSTTHRAATHGPITHGSTTHRSTAHRAATHGPITRSSPATARLSTAWSSFTHRADSPVSRSDTAKSVTDLSSPASHPRATALAKSSGGRSLTCRVSRLWIFIASSLQPLKSAA